MKDLTILFSEITRLSERDLHTAQIAIRGRMCLEECRRYLDATATYLALGCSVAFAERHPDGCLDMREGIVIGYTATCVKVRVGDDVISVPWRELNGR